MTSFPVALTLVDGAMAMDGGSIGLMARTLAGADVHLRLDWSITARRGGTPQFFVNDEPVWRGTEEEGGWLDLLRRAVTVYDEEPTPDTGTDAPPAKRLILSPDIADYFAAIDDGQGPALRALADRVVQVVTSTAYQHPVPYVAPPTPIQRVRLLLAAGRRMEAIRAYREAHPDVGVMEAKRAVLSLEAEG